MEISIRRVSTAIGSCGLPPSREVVVSILLSVFVVSILLSHFANEIYRLCQPFGLQMSSSQITFVIVLVY